jgi:cell division inhibitor SepF
MGILQEFKRLAKPYPEEQTDDFEELSNFSSKSKESKVRPAYDSAKNDKVLSINTTTQLQVVLVQPEHFEGVDNIAGHLLARNTVVLNLERANKEATRRMVDFLSGVIFALGGKVKPISKGAYIITHANIDVMGTDLIGELESSGMYI